MRSSSLSSVDGVASRDVISTDTSDAAGEAAGGGDGWRMGPAASRSLAVVRREGCLAGGLALAALLPGGLALAFAVASLASGTGLARLGALPL